MRQEQGLALALRHVVRVAAWNKGDLQDIVGEAAGHGGRGLSASGCRTQVGHREDHTRVPVAGEDHRLDAAGAWDGAQRVLRDDVPGLGERRGVKGRRCGGRDRPRLDDVPLAAGKVGCHLRTGRDRKGAESGHACRASRGWRARGRRRRARGRGRRVMRRGCRRGFWRTRTGDARTAGSGEADHAGGEGERRAAVRGHVVPFRQGIAGSSTLRRHGATGIAVLSQVRDRRTGSWAPLHREPDADHRALAVPAPDRDPSAVPCDDDPD